MYSGRPAGLIGCIGRERRSRASGDDRAPTRMDSYALRGENRIGETAEETFSMDTRLVWGAVLVPVGHPEVFGGMWDSNQLHWTRAAAVAEKARGYRWSAGELGRPKSWYRDVPDTDKAAEVSWLRSNVLGRGDLPWGLRITARDRYSDRCWEWGERLE